MVWCGDVVWYSGMECVLVCKNVVWCYGDLEMV